MVERKLKPKALNLKADSMVDVVTKETGLPRDIVQRILLFLNFAIYKSDGTLTKFAKTFNIKGYNDLYEFLKQTKELYRNDHETEAFSVNFNTLFKSVQPRASAWIFNTFVKFNNDLDQTEKYITANLYASSFTIRTFGQLMENLKLFQKIVKAMDKAKKEVQKFAESLNYKPQKGEEE